MPHKRNPIGSENVTGLARVIRGYMTTSFENIPLWHERDISHSSAERIIIPDATTLLNFMLNRFSKIIEELTVFPDMMRRNMDHSLGLVFSQQVMLALINKGLTREEAYELVQPLAMDAWTRQTSFVEAVRTSDGIRGRLSDEEIQACFDTNYHVKYVDQIFERLGL
jgi:adenylosuccinate lyase